MFPFTGHYFGFELVGGLKPVKSKKLLEVGAHETKHNQLTQKLDHTKSNILLTCPISQDAACIYAAHCNAE